MPLHPDVMTIATLLSEVRKSLYRIQAESTDPSSQHLAGSALIMVDASTEMLDGVDKQLKGGKRGVMIHYERNGTLRARFVYADDSEIGITGIDGTVDYVQEAVRRDNHVVISGMSPEGEELTAKYQETCNDG